MRMASLLSHIISETFSLPPLHWINSNFTLNFIIFILRFYTSVASDRLTSPWISLWSSANWSSANWTSMTVEWETVSALTSSLTLHSSANSHSRHLWAVLWMLWVVGITEHQLMALFTVLFSRPAAKSSTWGLSTQECCELEVVGPRPGILPIILAPGLILTSPMKTLVSSFGPILLSMMWGMPTRDATEVLLKVLFF